MYENLLENGDFTDGLAGWTYKDDADSNNTVLTHCENSSIRIDLARQAKQSLVQTHRFCTHPAMAVRSLRFSFNCKAEIKHADSAPKVLLCLEYSDNHSETKSFDLGGQNDWKCENIAFRVENNASLALKNAAVQILVPVGDGAIWLRAFELTYDPLDDPLKN